MASSNTAALRLLATLQVEQVQEFLKTSKANQDQYFKEAWIGDNPYDDTRIEPDSQESAEAGMLDEGRNRGAYRTWKHLIRGAIKCGGGINVTVRNRNKDLVPLTAAAEISVR